MAEKEPDKIQEGREDAPREQISETQHTLVLDGQPLEYTATAGTIVLREEEEGDERKSEGEKPKASIFVAYTLRPGHGADDVSHRASRPITFCFNGGPGSSSVWLHLGLLGPRRVPVTDERDRPLPPPFRLVDNAHSLLDRTDLVFIDPVSTGYSRAVPGEKPSTYHDFKKDIESVGDFVRLFATRFQRWASPKFLIGESYGTTRAAGLSGYLQNRHGMYLNGVMLISSILDFQSARFTPGNDLPYVLFLPTYAAAAWYHRRLTGDLQADLARTIAEVEAFAKGEYALALFQGASLPTREREAIVAKLARYTQACPRHMLSSQI